MVQNNFWYKYNSVLFHRKVPRLIESSKMSITSGYFCSDIGVSFAFSKSVLEPKSHFHKKSSAPKWVIYREHKRIYCRHPQYTPAQIKTRCGKLSDETRGASQLTHTRPENGGEALSWMLDFSSWELKAASVTFALYRNRWRNLSTPQNPCSGFLPLNLTKSICYSVRYFSHFSPHLDRVKSVSLWLNIKLTN